MSNMVPSNRGVNAILMINDIILGGQINATLNRRMSPITVTNKIKSEWSTSLAGVKDWSLSCSKMFIKDDAAFTLLEDAFNAGTAITVSLTEGNKRYTGSALITSFPVAANYNDTYTYNIVLLGTGPLT